MSGKNQSSNHKGNEQQKQSSTDSSKQARVQRGPGGRRGPHAMMGPAEKPKDFQGTMKKLFEELRPYQWMILFVFLLAIGAALFNILGPKILGMATTRIYEGAMERIAGTGTVDFAYVGRIIMILAGMYSASAVFAYIQGWVMSGVAMKISYNLRKSISEKINRLPFRYFDGTTHGDVLSRVTNDVDTLSQTLNQSLSQIITSVTTVLGVFVMMLTISVPMTVVVLIIIPLSMVLIKVIIKHSQKYFRQQQQYLGDVNGHVEEMYGGHSIVKAFNGEQKSIDVFDNKNDTLYESAWRAQFFSGVMMPMMNFVSNIGYVFVVIMGGFYAARRVIDVGDIQAFIQYVRRFTHPLSELANVTNILQQTAASAERVYEFLEEEEETDDDVAPTSITTLRGDVCFENISFGYIPDQPVIQNFSAQVKAGSKVALVGPTGAGKTTIVKLLMRFYDVNQGSIKVDDTDIRRYAKEELRKHIGMVLQDTWLYHASIMENIRYGRPDATDEEVIQAAKAAHVDGFVRTLPAGYDMMIDEEASNVSEGQKQLLTIARAFLADPRILILDEATSSVDTRTEVLIKQAMKKLMQGRTGFIIAHRLSTIRDADSIFVMDQGDIVEQGTHEQLLKEQGFYAKIYNSQFQVSVAMD